MIVTVVLFARCFEPYRFLFLAFVLCFLALPQGSEQAKNKKTNANNKEREGYRMRPISIFNEGQGFIDRLLNTGRFGGEPSG